ncbi:hypothetical protein CKQ90_35735, partial [Klebsiella pneumoniae]
HYPPVAPELRELAQHQQQSQERAARADLLQYQRLLSVCPSTIRQWHQSCASWPSISSRARSAPPAPICCSIS